MRMASLRTPAGINVLSSELMRGSRWIILIAKERWLIGLQYMDPTDSRTVSQTVAFTNGAESGTANPVLQAGVVIAGVRSACICL